ncbi:cytochrome ubiquinol oxidase subunit I [Undibacterium macrobrachii]|jgi:cytochrome d ubiquinol oxidase subunit I|uniref:Cytochrome ubiquinol oxidase subunit I n=1 Tax=Undibacterium macrobrachii TaxID=1119058 RepID=A0ABQ2XI86_9BURK|nr:cytochrome ubiquinol oxidase subunit I [Undibacterium macrobrachii]GGX19032.1 cytochrome ubiquinol oxidase subunit I [Undibacterium macrobrachii]
MSAELASTFDPMLLARIQFAANISFHILFPSISIALGWVLVFFKWRYNITKAEHWQRAYYFWVKIFALSFALGVVSGITMSFQFGTNWPGFMETVGNIAGPLLAYEILTAFFLEATFLGIMLFGQKRVGNRLHTIATILVASGTTLSVFWIIALNSWMHTPVGFEMINGQAHATSWLQIIFNPSMPYRFTHMMLASGLTVAFLIAGISAYRYVRGGRSDDIQIGIKTGVTLAAILVPLQILVGDLHGLNTLQHQPAKIAAMEGIWETQQGAPAVLFAIPDQTNRVNKAEIAIPKLASLYLTHDLNGELKGLNEFVGKHPPVAPVFFAFRVMVGVGLLMLAISWLACWFVWRKPALPTLVSRSLIAMSFSGWIALLAGWYTTEIGRQPYLVQGVLTTAEAAAKVPVPMLASSLAMYLALYVFLIISYISVVFYLARKADRTDSTANSAAVATPTTPTFTTTLRA